MLEGPVTLTLLLVAGGGGFMSVIVLERASSGVMDLKLEIDMKVLLPRSCWPLPLLFLLVALPEKPARAAFSYGEFWSLFKLKAIFNLFVR